MLSINWQTDYAFIIIHYLSRKESLVSIAEIAKEAAVPKQFAARIASDLAKKGILKSKEGKSGGYTLAKKLKDISVYEVVSTFEKNVQIVSCQKDQFACPLEYTCHHRNFFKNILSTLLTKELQKWNLEEIYRTQDFKRV